MPAELDRVPADRARRAGDRQHRPGCQAQHVQRRLHRHAVHRQRRGQLQRDAVRHPRELVCVDKPIFLVGAAGPQPRRHCGHHPVAGRPLTHGRPHRVDDARQVHPGNVRRRDRIGQCPPAGPEPQVGRVHRRCRDVDPDLAGARRRDGQRDHVQHRGANELSERDRAGFAHHQAPGNEKGRRLPRPPGSCRPSTRDTSSSTPCRCRCGRLPSGR